MHNLQLGILEEFTSYCQWAMDEATKAESLFFYKVKARNSRVAIYTGQKLAARRAYKAAHEKRARDLRRAERIAAGWVDGRL